MRKRNVLESPRLSELKRKRKKDLLKKILAFVFGLLVIFFFSIYFSRLEKLNISEIKINGNETLDNGVIENIVLETISNKYLGLFPKSNILYYPKEAIETNLKNNLNRLKDINLSVEENKILTVSVTERNAKYTWCGESKKTYINEEDYPKCYFLDENGYVFDEAPYFTGEVYFKFFGKLDEGEKNFFKKDFGKLVDFKQALEDMGIKPVSMYKMENGDIETFLSNSGKNSTEPKIMFRLDNDLQNTIENLKTALETEPLKSKFKNKYPSLLYIDLRFGNKVYSKFSN